MKTSAPTSISFRVPERFSKLVLSTSHRRMSEDPSGASYTALAVAADDHGRPLSLQQPDDRRPRRTDTGDDESDFRDVLGTTRSALISAPNTTIAVPC